MERGIRKILVPHVTNIKYKGFHPIEKKKTIKKVNLLIDKFNTFARDMDEKLNNIEEAEASTKKIKEIVVENGLGACYGLASTYYTDLTNRVRAKHESMMVNQKKEFEKFIKKLTTSGRTLENINKEIEDNDYWRLYKATSDGKGLIIDKYKYHDAALHFQTTFKLYVRKYMASTIQIIKTYLINKEKEKIGECKDYAQNLAKMLDAEAAKESLTEFEKTELKNLSSVLKKIATIAQNKSGNLNQAEIALFHSYFKGNRVYNDASEDVEEKVKEKYFLPMMNCEPATKKIILILMSILIDVGSKERTVKQTIMINLERYSKEKSKRESKKKPQESTEEATKQTNSKASQ